ncbi:hypothetical protein PM082_022792 [Marasmius tenuissimus]|nr:hypothetical protein PM082_022792 [Marasmius tenuissimus]
MLSVGVAPINRLTEEAVAFAVDGEGATDSSNGEEVVYFTKIEGILSRSRVV